MPWNHAFKHIIVLWPKGGSVPYVLDKKPGQRWALALLYSPLADLLSESVELLKFNSLPPHLRDEELANRVRKVSSATVCVP